MWKMDRGMHRGLVLAGALLFVGATAITVAAHSDGPTPYAPLRPDTDGVSGRFVGPAGPYVSTSSTGLVATGVLVCGADSAEPVDGTLDDGGSGGTCHTRYSGCADTDSSYDQVRGFTPGNGAGPVGMFVMSGCDSETTDDENIVTCAVNAVLGNRPGDIVNECPNRIDPTSPNPGTFISCGPDGSPDYTTTGYVDQTSGFQGAGTGGCSSGVASLWVFAGPDLQNGKVSAPTTGWVWTE